MTYFNRNGDPISYEEWSMLFEDNTYRVIKQTVIDDFLISTIWHGIDIFPSHYPNVFETVIIADDRVLLAGPYKRHIEQLALNVHAMLEKWLRGNIYAIRAAGLQQFLEVEMDLGSLQEDLAQLL